MATNPTVVSLSSLNGSNGFRLDGFNAYGNSGHSVSSAGDVNGDGFDDIIIGAPDADVGVNGSAGNSYVVFGKASGFGASFDLSSLNGTNGFRLNGNAGYDRSGYSVSGAGDINGDGFDDVLVGAKFASLNAFESEGLVYVVYGKASGFTSEINLASLNGTNGFVIAGKDGADFIGKSVSSAGDFNNDGFDDFLISSPDVDTGGDSDAGESYIVFGKAGTFGTSFDLNTLNGSNGFAIVGIDSSDRSGISLSSAGDVNGDGFDDIIVGAYWADQPGGVLDNGESYVIFGKASGFGSTFDLASIDGTNGFRIDGENGNDRSGYSVSAAGDVNGDGFDDVLVGAYGANNQKGETYVVFGKGTAFAGQVTVASLDGTNGFRISGLDNYDNSGYSVSSAGDVNGDGFDDIIIGALFADPNGQGNAGESYVVFGKASGFAADIVLSTLNGTNGFRIDGIDSGDRSGQSVSSAGDINGDGFDDLIIGAPEGDPDGVYGAGESYVIFGRATAAVNRTGTSVVDRMFGGDYNDTLNGAGGNDVLDGRDGTDRLLGGTDRDSLTGGTGRDTLVGGTESDRFKFSAGDSGRTAATMDRITDFAKGAVNIGDRFDFSSVLTKGGAGSAAAATATSASISQTTGIATFAAGSGTTLADALHDIATRWTAATDSLGEFALFKVNGTGAYHIFVSDGVAGVTANDVLVQLTNVTTIGSINLGGGDLTILT